MNTLMVSQTIFYIVSSVAIIALGGLLCYAAFQLIRILKDARDVSEGISKVFHKAKKRVAGFLGPKK